MLEAITSFVIYAILILVSCVAILWELRNVGNSTLKDARQSHIETDISGRPSFHEYSLTLRDTDDPMVAEILAEKRTCEEAREIGEADFNRGCDVPTHESTSEVQGSSEDNRRA